MTKPRRGKGKAAPAIEWTERAVADLRAIDDSIAMDDPVAAERWVGRLIAKAEVQPASRWPGASYPRKDDPTGDRSLVVLGRDLLGEHGG